MRGICLLKRGGKGKECTLNVMLRVWVFGKSPNTSVSRRTKGRIPGSRVLVGKYLFLDPVTER